MKHRQRRAAGVSRAALRVSWLLSVLLLLLASPVAANPDSISDSNPDSTRDTEPGATGAQRGQTPRQTIESFLEASRKNDFQTASQYLDVRGLGDDPTELARKLRVVLARTLKVTAADLSDAPEGAQDDGLSATRDRVGFIETPDGRVEIQLARVTAEGGERVWKFAGVTVAQVPVLYQTFGHGTLERWLPGFLFDFYVLEIALWQWLALLALAMLAGILAWLATGVLGFILRRRKREDSIDPEFVTRAAGPVRLIIATLIFRVGIAPLDLGIAADALVGYVVRVSIIVAFAWFLLRIIDSVANRMRDQLIARGEVQAQGLIAPTRRVIKIVLSVIAVVAVLDSMGFSITAIVASLGVGGIAVALAAQKTIENLFGGVTLYADQPVRVGDFCKFGTTVGTVEEIGIRSTRIRTLDRTLISVPNSDFSNLQIENFAMRDKMRLHTILQVGYDTTPDQMRYLLVELRKLLYAHPRTLPDPCRVRFVSLSAYSLDIELFVFVDSQDWSEFLGIRENIFLQVLDIVAASGAYFAYPSQTLYLGQDGGRNLERSEQAERAIAAMREKSELPLPEFSAEQIQALDDSLPFPEPGAVRRDA